MRLLAECLLIATAIAYAYLEGWLRGFDAGSDRALDIRDRLGD